MDKINQKNKKVFLNAEKAIDNLESSFIFIVLLKKMDYGPYFFHTDTEYLGRTKKQNYSEQSYFAAMCNTEDKCVHLLPLYFLLAL